MLAEAIGNPCPAPVAVAVTSWANDPYSSGAYTHIPPAANPADADLLGEPSFVFCSGTVGIDPATGVPGDGVEAQTELALCNLDAILTAAGTSLSALVKTTIFYGNVEDFAAINAVYARFMPDPPPLAPRRPTWRCHAACLSRSTPSPCFHRHSDGAPRRRRGPWGKRWSEAQPRFR